MKNRSVIVTGGCGFIGSHLIEALIEQNYFIFTIDDLSTGQPSNLPNSPLIKVLDCKIQNLDYHYNFKNLDFIFHLAAQTSVPVSMNKFFQSSSNNLDSMLKVWEIARFNSVPVTYASSSAIYGNLPIGDDEKEDYDIISPYALDKLTMEHYAKLCWDLYSVPSVGLRFFNVYGPRQDPTNPYSGVISIFIDRLLKNAPVTVNGGYQTRDFIYVKDIVNVLIKSKAIVRRQNGCNIFNVGTGMSVTIDQLLSLISDILNITPEIIVKDLPPGDPRQSDGTYEKLKLLLKTNPVNFTDLKTGLLATINYIKKESTY